MRAVNLIPPDARRGGVTPALGKLGAPHAVIGLLIVALAFVTVYVISSNAISSRRAQLAGVQQQISRVQADVTRLQSYEQFEKLAQARAQTVRQIASTRFDWDGALSDLSKVVPANTSLQSLVATTAPGAGGSGGGGSSVRGDIDAPAFELKGCTASQDEVAQLITRMRLIDGVTRVTLEDTNASGAASSGTGAPSTGGGCNAVTFDMVIFFQPVGSAASTTTAAVAK